MKLLLKELRRLVGIFKANEISTEEDGYWICHEVNAFEAIPNGMVSLTIPAQ
ncbi:hypothetical protein SAMN04488134_102280 [Amphibacillus marinus]|uniref:Uncharacterized protein n=1 Tax=Amphibacillus marinus TaxID=872970 RepID=A0A1H8KG94_9BACI|nr:hypothetical protein [Amphibacillus marinus]SEN91885.1 hypothetical protein SAMN04488134_102280 [Amphibacillus marinus]